MWGRCVPKKIFVKSATANGVMVKSATANCGNGGLGKYAIQQFVDIITDNKTANETSKPLDALIINCQEARFADIKKELEQMGLDGYVVTQVGGMETGTKPIEHLPDWLSRLNGPSGLVTFIVHKTTLTVDPTLPIIEARRSQSKKLNPRGYNKGGQIGRVTITKPDLLSNNKAEIDLISAHYESKNVVKRSFDHKNVYQQHQALINQKWSDAKAETTGKSDFDCLCDAIPNQLFYGADTNVRNQYKGDETSDIWQDNDILELQLLKYLPLANKQFTGKNTYKKMLLAKNNRYDFKNEPLAGVGGLDVNAYLGSIDETPPNYPQQTQALIDVDMSEHDIPNDVSTRDHVIVMSEESINIPYNDPNNNLNKLKTYMCGHLQHIRPKLVETIKGLEETEENKRYLILVFDMYFSTPNGKIQQLATQQQSYLEKTKKEFDEEKNDTRKKQIISNAKRRTKALWAENDTDSYLLLVNFNTLATREEKIKYHNLLEKTTDHIDVISPNHIPPSTFEQLKGQIGNYSDSLKKINTRRSLDSSKEPLDLNNDEQTHALIAKSMSLESKNALYQGVDKYQNEHFEEIKKFLGADAETPTVDDPNFFRKMLIDHLKNQNLPSISPDKERLRLSSPKKASISMTEFLDKTGVDIFKLALKEETNSKQYRDAVYFNSATFIAGKAWTQRPIHFIGGPSSSGKSYSAQRLIKYILSLLTLSNSEDEPGNLMIQADGGIVRETSQIRKLMIQAATSHGFTGLSDLQNKSKDILSPIKHIVRTTAFSSSMKVGVTIPETFASHTIQGIRYGAKAYEKLMIEASKLDNGTAKTFFSRTMPYIARSQKDKKNSIKHEYKKLVAFNGERRAFKSRGYNDEVIIDLNNTKIEESKKYEDNYDLGDTNSEIMEKWCIENIPNSCAMHVMVDLKLMEKDDGSHEKFCVSERVINAWQARDKLIQGDLREIDVSNQTIEQLLSSYLSTNPETSDNKRKHQCSLEGFNDFLIRLRKSPPLIVKGTKEVALQDAIINIKERIVQVENNKHTTKKEALNKVLDCLKKFKVNYQISNIETLRVQIQDAKEKISRGKIPYFNHQTDEILDELNETYKKIIDAYRLSNVTIDYNLLYDELKSTTTRFANTFKDNVDNNQFHKINNELIANCISERPEKFLLVPLERQADVYQKLIDSKTDINTFNAEILKSAHSESIINVDLFRKIVIENPILFYDTPQQHQKTVHNSLLHSLYLSENKNKANVQKAIDDIYNASLIEFNADTSTTSSIDAQSNIINQLYQKHLKEGARFKYHSEQALEIIVSHLNSELDTTNEKTFTELKGVISEEGFSLEIINKIIFENPIKSSNTCIPSFFKSAKESSYQCIFDLYEQLPGYQEKPKEEKINDRQLFKKNKVLPDIKDENIYREKEIKLTISALLENAPDNANTSLSSSILTKIHQHLNVQHRDKAASILANEAIYQNYLVNKGLSIALNNPKEIRFTLQAHALVSITLKEDDYKYIYHRILGNNAPSLTAPQTYQEALENTLNLGKLTKTTQCSLDINDAPSLNNKFIAWLTDSDDTSHNKQVLQHAINQLIEGDSRSSIISLQEEMEAHLNLLTRVAYEHFINSSDNTHIYSNEEWDNIKNNAFHQLSDEVRKIVQKGLIQSIDKEFHQLDYGKLNQYLDKQRNSLAQKMRQSFFTALSLNSNTQSKVTLTTFKSKLDALHMDHYTATGNDSFKTDSRNQTAIRITGTNHTSHNKKTNADAQANRMIKRTHYHTSNGIGTIRTLRSQNLEIRVPSLAVFYDEKGDEISDEAMIDDIEKKLAFNQQWLSKSQGGMQTPVVYNLLTSIDPMVDFVMGGKNKQTQSASLIIKGAHQFNRTQLKENNLSGLFFIQNIPVNQHGRELNLGVFDPIAPINEISLMAEMAMLATINSHQRYLSTHQANATNQCYKTTERLYISYLRSKSSEKFSDTRQGKRAIDVLMAYKKNQNNRLPKYIKPDKKLTLDKKVTVDEKIDFTKNKTLQHLVAQSLMIMHSNNQHQNLQFGMTIQSLSIFLEHASIAGCKSANERYASVNGRVELLKSMSNRIGIHSNSEQERALYSALHALTDNEIQLSDTELTQKIKAIQKALDTAYNDHDLQGSSTDFSKEDQGAPAKVLKSSKNNSGQISELTTNYAESSHVSWLFQGEASKLQAHNKSYKKNLHNDIDSALNTNEDNHNPLNSQTEPTLNHIPTLIEQLKRKVFQLALLPEKETSKEVDFKKSFCTDYSINLDDFSWPAFYALLNKQKQEHNVKFIFKPLIENPWGINILLVEGAEEEEKDLALFDNKIKYINHIQNQWLEIKENTSQSNNQLLMRSPSPIKLKSKEALALSSINNIEQHTSPLKTQAMTKKETKQAGVVTNPIHVSQPVKENNGKKLLKNNRPPVVKKETLISDEKAIQAVKEVLKINIFDAADINTVRISDAINNESFHNTLNTMSSVGCLILNPEISTKYKNNLEELIHFLTQEEGNLINDLDKLNPLLNHQDIKGHSNVIAKLNEKIGLLKDEKKDYNELIRDLTALKIKFDSRLKESSKPILTQSNIITTIIESKNLPKALKVDKTLTFNASIKGTPLKTLEQIPKGSVALHQFKHNGESLAFIESEKHDELKAIKPKIPLSEAAKMKLAFVMAQKFLMNFDGVPTESNPIYLKGKDLKLIGMIHTAFHVLADKTVLAIDVNAINVQSEGYAPLKIDSKTSQAAIDTMKKALGETYLKEMTELSKEVQQFKTDDSKAKEFEALSSSIYKIKYQLNFPKRS